MSIGKYLGEPTNASMSSCAAAVEPVRRPGASPDQAADKRLALSAVWRRGLRIQRALPSRVGGSRSARQGVGQLRWVGPACAECLVCQLCWVGDIEC